MHEIYAFITGIPSTKKHRFLIVQVFYILISYGKLSLLNVFVGV